MSRKVVFISSNILRIQLYYLYLTKMKSSWLQYVQGRTFTTQYFVQTPIKAETKKKEYALFQSSIHPPHFKLLVGDEVWEVR